MGTVGVGEDSNTGDDSKLPASIPWARRSRATRRRGWWSSIRRGSLETAALGGGNGDGSSVLGFMSHAEEREIERDRREAGQGEELGVAFLSTQRARSGSAGARRERGPSKPASLQRDEEDDRGDFAPSPLAFSFSFLPALFSFILFLISITDLNLNY